MTNHPLKRKPTMDELFPPKRVELVCGLFMLMGIVFCFFLAPLGAALVGFSIGVGFFSNILKRLLKFRMQLSESDIFPTLMGIGFVIFLFLVIPPFIVALAGGFAAMWILKQLLKPTV